MVSCGKWWVDDDTLVRFRCAIDRNTVLIIRLFEGGSVQFQDVYEYFIRVGQIVCQVMGVVSETVYLLRMVNGKIC